MFWFQTQYCHFESFQTHLQWSNFRQLYWLHMCTAYRKHCEHRVKSERNRLKIIMFNSMKWLCKNYSDVCIFTQKSISKCAERNHSALPPLLWFCSLANCDFRQNFHLPFAKILHKTPLVMIVELTSGWMGWCLEWMWRCWAWEGAIEFASP